MRYWRLTVLTDMLQDLDIEVGVFSASLEVLEAISRKLAFLRCRCSGLGSRYI